MTIRRFLSDRRTIGVLCLAAVTLLVFWPFLTGRAFLWNDFAEYTYPTQVFATKSLAQGVMPWWNPFVLNGMPFIADPQVGFFYLPNQLMYRLADGTLTTALLQAVVVLHYFVAMIAMWVLARGRGIGAWGALLSAIGFALSGPMLAHMIHPNMIEQLAWWPLGLHLLLTALERRSAIRAIGCGLLLGASFLAGHPQTAVYELASVAAVTAWFAFSRAHKTEAARHGGLGALACVVAVGLFAIQWLPSMELVQQSERAQLTRAQSLQDALAPGQLMTLVAPRFFGVHAPRPVEGTVPFWNREGIAGGATGARSYWETIIYVGIAILVLAIAGLASRRLGSFGWLLTGLAALGLVYALGDVTPLHALLANLPVIGTFRAPARLGIYLALAAPLLAGAGLDALLAREARAVRAALFAAGTIAIVAAQVVTGSAGALLSVPYEFAAAARASGVVPLVIALLSAAIASLAIRETRATQLVAPAFIILVLADLGWFGPSENRGTVDPMRDVYQVFDVSYAGLVAHTPRDLFRAKIRNYRSGDALVPRNQGSFSGMMLFDGYNPLRLAHQVPWAATDSQRLDLLAVRYDYVDGGPPKKLVTRTGATSPVRMVFATRTFGDDSAAKREIMTGLDLDSVVVLDAEPPFVVSGGTGAATITRYDAGSIEVDVTTTRPGILLLSEIWYPAWRAEVDGAPARVFRADGALRAVAVPGGNHHVRLRYASSTATAGAAISAATLLFAGAGLLLGRRRKPTRRG